MIFSSKGKEPICVDTNIVLGYGRKIAKERKRGLKYKKIKEIKTGEILEILSKNYQLFCSFLLRYEFIKNLKDEEGILLNDARSIYEELRKKFDITEISFKKGNINITYEFLENLLETDVNFQDGLHILTAVKLGKKHRTVRLVSGNTKHLLSMKKLYSEVVSPQEIFKEIKR